MTEEEVDYGYGDGQPDYGYGAGAPDEVKPKSDIDYGYGEASPMDYDYGEAPPASNPSEDYGYGNAQPSMDYGYGDDAPVEKSSMDYGDGATASQLPPDRRPKRRCSVTKYTIENEDKESPLTAHTRINDFRNGGSSATTKTTTPPTSEESGSFEKSADEGEPKTKVKKKGMMHRIRKRLSIVT